MSVSGLIARSSEDDKTHSKEMMCSHGRLAQSERMSRWLSLGTEKKIDRRSYDGLSYKEWYYGTVTEVSTDRKYEERDGKCLVIHQ